MNKPEITKNNSQSYPNDRRQKITLHESAKRDHEMRDDLIGKY